MNRQQFDHAIRAAAAVLGIDELIVIGSQAVHGSMTDLPDVATVFRRGRHRPARRSGWLACRRHRWLHRRGLDVPRDLRLLQPGCLRTDRGLARRMARGRLVRYESPATNGVVAWCLEIHDLWIAKAIANREKDQQFCRALLEAGLVDTAILEARLAEVREPVDDRRAVVEAFIRSLSGS